MVKYPKLKRIDHDSKGLMTAMFDELNLLREGKSTVARLNSVVKATQNICVLAKLHSEGVEIEPKKLPTKR